MWLDRPSLDDCTTAPMQVAGLEMIENNIEEDEFMESMIASFA